jgi:hypothetical protein
VARVATVKKEVSPAELIVARFGGVRPLGRLLNIDPSAISKWISRGGRIPNNRGGRKEEMHRALLTLAEKRKVKLTAEELIYGGVP